MGDIMPNNEKFVREVAARINRCEGHLGSIGDMVRSGRTCESLFVQLAAVRSALNEISLKVYEHHIEKCLGKGARKSSLTEVRELKFISKLLLSGKI